MRGEVDNAIAAGLIDEIYNHRQRRCFARARRAGDDNQTVTQKCQSPGEVGRDAGPSKIGNLVLDEPQTGSQIATCEKQVGAKAKRLAVDHRDESEVGIFVVLQLGQ